MKIRHVSINFKHDGNLTTLSQEDRQRIEGRIRCGEVRVYNPLHWIYPYMGLIVIPGLAFSLCFRERSLVVVHGLKP